MLKHEKRRMKMIQRLESEGVLYLSEMSLFFNLSKETIRQDFDALAQREDVKRIHGGIRREKKVIFHQNYIFHEHKQLHLESKKALAFQALKWIEDGMTLFLDSGSTVACLFQYLNFKKNLKIVSSSIPLLIAYIEPEAQAIFRRCGHQFIFVGGHVDHGILGTYGPFFDQMTEQLHLDLLFFSCDAFDLKQGLSNADDVPFAVIQKLKKQALRTVALIDESKIGKIATFKGMVLDEVDVLITDYAFSEEEKIRLAYHQVALDSVKTT